MAHEIDGLAQLMKLCKSSNLTISWGPITEQSTVAGSRFDEALANETGSDTLKALTMKPLNKSRRSERQRYKGMYLLPPYTSISPVLKKGYKHCYRALPQQAGDGLDLSRDTVPWPIQRSIDTRFTTKMKENQSGSLLLAHSLQKNDFKAQIFLNSEMEKQITSEQQIFHGCGKEDLLDFLIGEKNPIIPVNVMWKGALGVFQIRKTQKFAVIFNTLAKREKLAPINMVFELNNRDLSPSDTPISLGYDITFLNNHGLQISK